MVRQTKPRKPGNNVLGKGKVTPVQVAFIVDQYLADNNFAGTRSLFRSEASSLLARSSAQEAPKSLLSLKEMLDDYISLKEQKVVVNQAKSQLEQENVRVQSLLNGMQDLLVAYNSSAALSCITPPPPLVPSSVSSVVPSKAYNSAVSSPAGYTAFNTPLISSVSVPEASKRAVPANFSIPVLNSNGSRKRKIFKSVPEPTKRSCGVTSNNQSTTPGTITRQPHDHVASPLDNIGQSSAFQSMTPHGSPIQGSTVAKNLFNQTSSQSPHSNSTGPKTPQRSVSSSTDKFPSPPEVISSTAKSNQPGTSSETTPTNCTIISSKTIILSSPAKNFSVERKLCTIYSPSKSNLMTQGKRDHVKGRLDFDTTDLPVISENASFDVCTTSESDRDGDIFDFDLDSLGPNFSLSELLNDFDLDCGGVGYSCPEAIGASTGPLDRSLSQPDERNFCVSQEFIEEGLTGKDSITSLRSITQCIQISSPAKKTTRSNDN